MTQERPTEIDQRVAAHVDDSDLGWVTAALTKARDPILDRWLDAATDQPFHAGHREHAVTDHIPRLLDALIAFLARGAPRRQSPGAPLEDDAILAAARAHARVRLDQGLEPVDVVVEFRLLRQEILGALRTALPDSVPTGDVIAAELLINDALDGAIALGLRALTDLIESIREDFLATTIHEVRQPLTLIKGSAQVVARLLQQPQPNLEYAAIELQRIDRETMRMTSLLDQLIDASRIALQHLDLRPEPVDLAALVRTVAAELGPATAERVTLQHDSAADVTGSWDRDRLAQVVRNLLSNAVKYSPAGAPIEVGVRAGPEQTVELRVQDHGVGVTAEELPQLFQRYGRTRGAVERGIEGLGLGLYLCRGIIQAHGGRIWADSPGSGQGTTFHVVLPRQVPTAES